MAPGRILVLVVMVGFATHARAQADPVDQLRAASEAFASGRYADCVQAIAGLGRAYVRNPDVALLLEGQCRFYRGEFESARKSFTRLARLEGPHRALAYARLGDSAWELGDPAQAAGAYRKASTLSADPRVDPGVGLYNRMQYHLRQGRSIPAARLWIDLRIRVPAHPLTSAYPAGHPEPRLDFKDALQVARSLHDARCWERALAVLDEAPEPQSSRDRFLLGVHNGRVLFDMRDRYDQALRFLQGARNYAPGPVEAEEAWFFASRALGRLDRDDQAVQSHLSMVRRHPKGKHAPRALFYAGFLEQNQGRCDRALPLLQRVWMEYADNRWAREARWTAAWCHIRKRAWKKTIDALSTQLTGGQAEINGRALYWTGVAHAALGAQRPARAVWRKLVRRFPLTWYALLARERLGEHAPALSRPPLARKQEAKAGTLLRRAGELTSAGLGPLASVLLRHEEARYLSTRKKRAGLVALLFAHRSAGNFNRPWRLTLRHAWGSLKRLPTRDTRTIWDHAYPPCARGLIRKHAGNDRHLVLFLSAIMRTESGFDPMALSTANARGLMQMIPPTAKRVAGILGIDYADDRLFEPDFNVQTATWYIGRLVRKFRRQWPLAASAYNGGTPAMMKWCKKNGHLPLDMFIEAIPWTESRRYAKRVTAAFARYAYLEGAPMPRLSLKLNPDFLVDDIDY